MPFIFFRIQKYIKKHKLLVKDDNIILSFSGGSDSVFLFYFLKEYVSLDNLFLIYFDHGLRSKNEIEKDKKILSSITEKYQITSYIKKIPVKSYAKKNKLSVETAGRKLRRENLITYANKLNVTKICTAHHLDDLCETFFQQIIRGARSGLKGIKPISIIKHQQNNQAIYIIRPLLTIKKSEILEYLKKYNIGWSEDSTNKDLEFNRNKIRNQIMPLIEELNPAYRNSIYSYLEYLKDWNRFQEDFLVPHLKYLKKDKKGVLYPKDKLKKLPVFFQKQIIFMILNELVSENKAILSVHIEDIISVFNKSGFKEIHLPGGLYCYLDQKKIYFQKQ